MIQAEHLITSLPLDGGENVAVIEVDGRRFVPMHAFADRFGLPWRCQREKLKRNADRYGTRVLRVVFGAGAAVEQPCMPISGLAQWLARLTPRSRQKVGEHWIRCFNHWLDQPAASAGAAAKRAAARSLADLRWNRSARRDAPQGAASDWMLRLRQACEYGGQRQVGNRLGFSATVVNQVLKGTYRGRLDRVENAVRSELMSGLDAKQAQDRFQAVSVRIASHKDGLSTPGES